MVKQDENRLDGIINDLDGGPYYSPGSKSHQDYWYRLIQVQDLIKMLDEEKIQNTAALYPEKKKQLIALIESLAETDNPILIIMKWKN